MNPPSKHISVADIHLVYGGTQDLKQRPAADAAPQTYRTTSHFVRDSSHPGVSPARPLAPNTRYRR
jgi:hypothetical protein